MARDTQEKEVAETYSQKSLKKRHKIKKMTNLAAVEQTGKSISRNLSLVRIPVYNSHTTCPNILLL